MNNANRQSGATSVTHDARVRTSAQSTTRVGVVIVNFNSGDWLLECLQSLTRQTRPADRVVVVDNASSDDSVQRAASIIASLDVELVQSPTNLGFAAGNNLAVESLLDVDWIALLNPDATADPRWLEAMLDASQREPGYRFFGARMNQANTAQVLDGIGDVYHASGLVWRAGHGRAAQIADTEAHEIFSPCAAAALYRRDDFVAAGGFDDRYFCYSEDVDLGFRLRLAGHRCLYVPQAVVEHAGSGITGERSSFTIYHGHRNLIWTYLKNMPGYLLWLYLPQHLLMNLVSLAYLTLRGSGGAALRAKRDALCGLGWVLKERRRIQRERRVTPGEIRAVLSRNPLAPYLYRHG